ncbi:TFIIB-type zinc ribbon-containing protein [Planctomonas psychrotolerans]|uniref:TFIIB-type zinc ribbon-containing protein n=1 Tax=Planctomonas psychrotolerans TaxID=2528712 RepID=UPI00123A95E9|nr:zf-TFIIB domain-containing protein [Planctomonas psychrotolerans]
MKCPNDSATLVMSERSGVEIDYCPECRGVWLDRGELDKILERAEAESAASAPRPSAAGAVPPPPYPDPRYTVPGYGERPYGERPRERDRDDYDRRSREYDTRGGYRGKKKESWLSDLFD